MCRHSLLNEKGFFFSGWECYQGPFRRASCFFLMAERPLIRRPFQPLRSFLFFLFSSGKKGGVFRRRRNYLAFAVNALITADNCSFSDSPLSPSFRNWFRWRGSERASRVVCKPDPHSYQQQFNGQPFPTLFLKRKELLMDCLRKCLSEKAGAAVPPPPCAAEESNFTAL